MSAPTVTLNFGEGGPVKSSSFSGGLFINNEFVAGEGGKGDSSPTWHWESLG